ncbi:MAG: DUF1549 and DUF1553 domain-containing protein, partial [Planctomycetaceae bacterium]
EASQQLLVTEVGPSGAELDVTRQVSLELAAPGIAFVDSFGLVRPLAEGHTEILVRQGAEQARIWLTVSGLQHPAPVSFEHEIIPLLTKAGCNAGGCHGKAEGKNGFKLSVFGFDASADYDSLTKQSRGRRIDRVTATSSLLLRKATAYMPHGGGRRIEQDGPRYQRLHRWIAEGARFEDDGGRAAVAIEVEPAQRSVVPAGTQQLRVTAIDASGRRQCVTAEAEYTSNAASIADVNERGLIQAGKNPGEAAILIRYMGQVAVSRITLPRAGVNFQRPAESTFIDKLVWDKLERLGIPPSEPADDATFLRRAYLDVIGTLPTPDEARAFLASPDADKRAHLVDELLTRDEYADYWAMRWADLLRVDKTKITPQGAVAMHRWLRRQFAENRPYDEFVREIVTARGSTRAEGPAAFYQALDTPEVLSRSISQLFLGVRIECAQCHHHPFEKWGQDDYFALAGFFTGVVRKGIADGGLIIHSDGGSDLVQPRTGQKVPTHALAAQPIDLSNVRDHRSALADWMTDPNNPFFARVIVNRLWSHYFGRGLIEPIDDLRQTNPAVNEPLLDALAAHLRDLKYDLKAFTRTLLASRVYQLGSQPNESNIDDVQNFSHAAYKTLPAEVLLDAMCRATGVAEKFNGWPEGYRAVDIWDSQMPSYFFRIFGRPTRVSVCQCERSDEPSIAQALHLMNSPEIAEKIRHRRGRARELADSKLTPSQIVDALYLGVLARYPGDDEQRLMLSAFQAGDGNRRTATEDILWALLNSKEFLFNH